ncbi:MAG: DUF4157 domain-containing protein [Caldimonas sp.]
MQKALPAPKPVVAPRHSAPAPRHSAPAARPGEDAAERDAERRAERALAQPGLACACGGGCPLCRPASAAPAGDGAAGEAPASVAPVLRGAGQPLSAGERAFMEPRLGADFGAVRVHDDARAGAAAASVGAQAFAFREHLVFGAGRRGDTRLLAHELAHVVEQRESGARLQRSVEKARAPAPGSISGVAPPATGGAKKAAPRSFRNDPAFREWWKHIAGYEGTLEDWEANPGNKDDKGGRTQSGITENFYKRWAASLGLDPSDAGFRALTAEGAMRFGEMVWRSSGASRIKNPGVAIVLGDWYWGGISLKRLTAILKRRGFTATYDQGSPSPATTDFMNTQPPDELLEEMSDAKADQYEGIAKADPTQQKFLGGWLKRNEERRQQARAFAPKPGAPPPPAKQQEPQGDLWQRAQRALRHARDADTSDERIAAIEELEAVIGAIDRREAQGFAHAEEAVALHALRNELGQARGGISSP